MLNSCYNRASNDIIPLFILSLCSGSISFASNNSMPPSSTVSPQNKILLCKDIIAENLNQKDLDSLSKEAENGCAEAWFYMGTAYLGKKKPQYYFEKAAELGYRAAFERLFDDFLFRSDGTENKPDIFYVKKMADLARKFNIKNNIFSEKLRTIDLCFEAGKIIIPDSDKPSAFEKNKFDNVDCDTFALGL